MGPALLIHIVVFSEPNDAVCEKFRLYFLMNKNFSEQIIFMVLDPFNLVTRPGFEPEYFAEDSIGYVHATLTAADPKAQWMKYDVDVLLR